MSSFNYPSSNWANYKVKLKMSHQGFIIECTEDKYITDAADEEGMDLPYPCYVGACGTYLSNIESDLFDEND